MRDRCSDNRDALIQRYLPLARTLARRYHHGREPFEDLFQVACEALVKAARGYDAERGFSFTSYAAPSIEGALKRYFRDCTWAVHVPRSTKDRALALRRMESEGRVPNDAELARMFGCSLDQVREARAAAATRAVLSLDAPPADGEEALVDGLAAPIEPLGDDIQPMLGSLPRRQRAIVGLRFRDDLTQGEIAERIGISQMHVSRLLRDALSELRSSYELAAA